MLAIPARPVDRQRAGMRVLLRIERPVDRPIVRQTDGDPPRIVEIRLLGTVGRALQEPPIIVETDAALGNRYRVSGGRRPRQQRKKQNNEKPDRSKGRRIQNPFGVSTPLLFYVPAGCEAKPPREPFRCCWADVASAAGSNQHNAETRRSGDSRSFHGGRGLGGQGWLGLDLCHARAEGAENIPWSGEPIWRCRGGRRSGVASPRTGT